MPPACRSTNANRRKAMLRGSSGRSSHPRRCCRPNEAETLSSTMAAPLEANDRNPGGGEEGASSPGTQPNSIAWLLLRARSTSGNGLFAHVQFIQRLNTVGGSVPAGGCTRQQAGQQLRAAYTADYLFYGMKH